MLLLYYYIYYIMCKLHIHSTLTHNYYNNSRWNKATWMWLWVVWSTSRSSFLSTSSSGRCVEELSSSSSSSLLSASVVASAPTRDASRRWRCRGTRWRWESRRNAKMVSTGQQNFLLTLFLYLIANTLYAHVRHGMRCMLVLAIKFDR